MSNARTFSPIDAAYAVAQYLPADPAVWLERCGLAGITVCLNGDGITIWFVYGEQCEFSADQDQIDFLQSWLNLTPGGSKAVAALLRKRAEGGAA